VTWVDGWHAKLELVATAYPDQFVDAQHGEEDACPVVVFVWSGDRGTNWLGPTVNRGAAVAGVATTEPTKTPVPAPVKRSALSAAILRCLADMAYPSFSRLLRVQDLFFEMQAKGEPAQAPAAFARHFLSAQFVSPSDSSPT
jgi:hypothetical protein